MFPGAVLGLLEIWREIVSIYSDLNVQKIDMPCRRVFEEVLRNNLAFSSELSSEVERTAEGLTRWGGVERTESLEWIK